MPITQPQIHTKLTCDKSYLDVGWCWQSGFIMLNKSFYSTKEFIHSVSIPLVWWSPVGFNPKKYASCSSSQPIISKLYGFSKHPKCLKPPSIIDLQPWNIPMKLTQLITWNCSCEVSRYFYSYRGPHIPTWWGWISAIAMANQPDTHRYPAKKI